MDAFGYNARMSKETLRKADLQTSDPGEIVQEILNRLDQLYGTQTWEPSGLPVDELVATILSQNTSDVNTDRAFTALRAQFTDWNAVIDATVQEIESAIKPGGLAAQKAPRIKNILARIVDREATDPNTTLLEHLQSMDPADAMTWLTGFNGVGPKTAACVLLFAVGMPVVPVDTHVHRVANRIGIIDEGTNAVDAHDELLTIVSPDDAYRFHMHLIQHGRATCRARTPRCEDCILNDICLHGRRRLANA
jgi:endonuclease III